MSWHCQDQPCEDNKADNVVSQQCGVMAARDEASLDGFRNL
jgi:hypothetical protein